MVVLGLVLLLVCLVVGAGAALSNPEPATLGVFGIEFAGLTVAGLVLLGVGLGLVAMLAIGMIVTGATRKRAKRQRVKQVGRERETLAEENTRLQAELEERGAHSYPEAPVAPPTATSPQTTTDRPGTAL